MKFVVVGAGAWGTAFALHVCRSGHQATLVPRRALQASELNRLRENVEYLPGIKLPAEVRVTAELRVALENAEVVMLACPTQALRPTAQRIRDEMRSGDGPRLLISLAKGLELAAKELEVAAADLEFARGEYRVKGTDVSIPLTSLAQRHPGALDSLQGIPGPMSFPGGAHVAEVEIDPETGVVEVASYVAVDDCGRVLNPVLLHGQVVRVERSDPPMAIAVMCATLPRPVVARIDALIGSD